MPRPGLPIGDRSMTAYWAWMQAIFPWLRDHRPHERCRHPVLHPHWRYPMANHTNADVIVCALCGATLETGGSG
jgi:hypothetical protein